jgi:tetratricopeptide (TPR) repeat protein
LRGLSETQRQILHTLAAFRMPATWDTLRALLVQSSRRQEMSPKPESGKKARAPKERRKEPNKSYAGDRALDEVLTELEDRGLMGWDKQANRYDLHPIVRAVVWATLALEAKQGLYRELHTHFDAAPRPPEWEKVESLEDLTPTVELFDKLIGLERYEDALVIFRDHLNLATLYRLSASRLRVELLERLFPEGVDAPPRLDTASTRRYALNALAHSYLFGGELGQATRLYRRMAEIDARAGNAVKLAFDFYCLGLALWPSGHLRESESASRRALGIAREREDRFREGACLSIVGTALAARGEAAQSQVALSRSIAIWIAQSTQQGEGAISAYLAQRYLWFDQLQDALQFTRRAWKLAQVQRVEADFIRAARLHAEAALGLGDLATAQERLHHALTRARAVNLVEEELPALTALAELHRLRQECNTAREMLEQVWAPAERGPYPLRHADARNVLARVERDEGHRDAAIAAAARGYELAWCDGPPYAYHYGLTNAKQLLAELGAPEPQLPPFDESKFEPMPDVEINPKDEFWVDPATLDSTVEE